MWWNTHIRYPISDKSFWLQNFILVITRYDILMCDSKKTHFNIYWLQKLIKKHFLNKAWCQGGNLIRNLFKYGKSGKNFYRNKNNTEIFRVTKPAIMCNCLCVSFMKKVYKYS